MNDEARLGEILSVLEATPKLLEHALGLVPPADVERAMDADWSPKDVVAHMILAERLGAVGRVRLMLDADRPALPAWDENEELERSGLRSHSLEALVGAFTEMRNDGLTWLRALAPADLERTGVHSEVGELTVVHSLNQAAYHDALHLGQLFGMLGAHFEPHRGPLRVF